MIKIIAAYLTADGENYSPKKIESEIGTIFTKSEEVGELGRTGRYKNKPLPYGSAIIEFSDAEISDINQDDFVPYNCSTLQRLIKNIDLLKDKADFIKIHFEVAYESQCNLAMTPEFLKAISSLGIDATISCYQDESEFDDQHH